jgi:hypothetical protein
MGQNKDIASSSQAARFGDYPSPSNENRILANSPVNIDRE